MRCIYFTGEKCEAAPIPRLVYDPNEQEKKEVCVGTKFGECPRYRAFIEHMRAQTRQTH